MVKDVQIGQLIPATVIGTDETKPIRCKLEGIGLNAEISRDEYDEATLHIINKGAFLETQIVEI